jgi:hypothetical protein
MTNNYPTFTHDAVYSFAFLDSFCEQIQQWSLALFDPGSGGFRRNADIGPNVLSTTDIVWIRYAVNDADLGAPDREGIVRFIQGKQDPITGKIPHDPGPAGQRHSDGHAFWQAVRALRILGAEPLHFPAHLKPMLTKSGMDAWFADFNWDGAADERRTGIPWATTGRSSRTSLDGGTNQRPGNHHEVLGLIPGVVSVGDEELTDNLFRNIAKQQNPETGTWPRAKTNVSRTFAYTALHMSAGRLPNMPEGILDEVLRLQNDNGLWDAPLPGFHTMDSAYLLVRLPQRVGYREADALAALRRLSAAMRRVYAAEQATILGNTHQLLAVAHTFGLLQEVFPEEYPSERPYRFDWDKLDLYDCEIIRSSRQMTIGVNNR